MNITKLVRRNLARPMSQRIALSDIQSAVSIATQRGTMVALLATIHQEIAPQLAAMRRADDLLERVTRTHNGVESQGYANLLGCSRLDVYTMGHTRRSESLVSSESFEACTLAGMDKAETVSRHIADNN